MRINQNVVAMNTYSRLTGTNNTKRKSLEKLSLGLRINRAGDDAAGLAISEKMRGQVVGLKQATRNAQDGISLIQTAEGALIETHSILNRMRDLAVQAANDTNTDADREKIQEEIDQLIEEIDRISTDTGFNTQNLLVGDFKVKLQIGANEGRNILLEIGDMSVKGLNLADSGEIKANFAIMGAQMPNVTANSGIVAGEQTLNVVKVDNIVLADGEVASYALSNDKGEIVATSKNGERYTMLDGAYKASDLIKAKADINGSLSFTDAVIGGQVTVKGDTDGRLDIYFRSKATASIDVKGLEPGDYTAKRITDANFSDYFGPGKTEIVETNGLTRTDIVSVLVDKDGNVAAVEFANGGANTSNTNKHYAVKDIDLKASNAMGGGYILDAVIGQAEGAMKRRIAAADGTKISINGGSGIDVLTHATANDSIIIIDEAIALVSAERSKLGANQNRLEHTINNLTSTAENLSEAESRIRDVDMAEEMMKFTKNNILSQASTSMLAQANQMPQPVLQLLQ